MHVIRNPPKRKEATAATQEAMSEGKSDPEGREEPEALRLVRNDGRAEGLREAIN